MKFYEILSFNHLKHQRTLAMVTQIYKFKDKRFISKNSNSAKANIKLSVGQKLPY